MRRVLLPLAFGVSLIMAQSAVGQSSLNDLPTLFSGRTAAKNALYTECDVNLRFHCSKRVTIAEIQGPATITMIHFAMPGTMQLNRDVLLKAYWDGEKEPSVDCPLVDFFCDPAGTRDEVNTALVNKRRGWNTYFPMPFRKSARIELVYDGPLTPGEQLWRRMPAYSYVMYRTLDGVADDAGYFHAHWRQEDLLLGKRNYVALEATGKGKFVGWNVTVRWPGLGRGHPDGFPVDENEKFFVDGEKLPSVEFQGLEDSFGFSWSFPETQSMFPLTGYFPFFKGACCYRFLIQDAVIFQKALRVAIGFGHPQATAVPVGEDFVGEDAPFDKVYGRPESRLQFSSTAYWYQVEPHAALPAMPSPAERAPAPEDPSWWKTRTAPSAQK